jgi:putative polyketide hydroxylase
VVGGGLVGLSAALLLRAQDVDVVVLERRGTCSAQPKARRFGFRSMEIFRGLGLASIVRDAARELAGHDHFATGATLAEAQQLPMWAGGAPDIDPATVGPEPPSLIAQDVLEPVLARAARRAGAELRFGSEVDHVSDDDDGVTVTVRDDQPVRARYVVAADGAHSPIRRASGITRSGPGAVGEPSVSVYFRADLGEVVKGREFNLCFITCPDASGTLASVDGRRRWVFMSPAGDTSTDWPAVLRAATGTGLPDLEILDVSRWRAAMLVADRYRHARVFLVGDAAHVMPPFAAAGANTGIGDVANLAWKLGAVVHGEADEALLDTYDTERRPTGWFIADQSRRRGAQPGAPGLAHPFVLSAEQIQYTGGALIHTQPPSIEPTDTFVASGAVGTRVPHRWLDADHRVSTLDLTGPGWAVLGPAELGDATSAGDDRCLLVRPDNIVAWGGPACDDVERVRRALLRPTKSGLPTG